MEEEEVYDVLMPVIILVVDVWGMENEATRRRRRVLLAVFVII